MTVEHPDKSHKRIEAATITIEKETGFITSLIGGRNYSTSQYNRAIHSKDSLDQYSNRLFIHKLF